MTQNAQVIALMDDGTARVRVERISACGHDCNSCEGCGMQAAPIEAIAVNRASAEIGDLVVVESASNQIISIAALTYLLPVVLFFVAFFLARTLGVKESFCSIIGILGFCIGLLGAVWSNRRGQVPTVITEIIKKGGSECSDI